MFPPQVLHCALSDSLDSGVFVDTKFYLFSRRNASGKVCRPWPLYANSLTLKSVPYFKDREYLISCSHTHHRINVDVFAPLFESYPGVSPKAQQKVSITIPSETPNMQKTMTTFPTATSRMTPKSQSLSQKMTSQKRRTSAQAWVRDPTMSSTVMERWL